MVLHQAQADNKSTLEDVQAHINQTIATRGSEIFYSPNYEEDLRREMFPIVSNLISTVTSICDQNGIPSGLCFIKDIHEIDTCTLSKWGAFS